MLLTLLDSPLNKAGKLQVYIHTEKNVLIEVPKKKNFISKENMTDIIHENCTSASAGAIFRNNYTERNKSVAVQCSLKILLFCIRYRMQNKIILSEYFFGIFTIHNENTELLLK